ncbi:hypothetical protein SEPCBS119000_002208 [Sporothrix epigloea]|uniref:Peptidase family m20 m25 m40 protein n=1 Tax=Sporothrix epigloea TaxID=1892477 RepID=A0ABP0DHM4_9PEZI
MSEATAEAATGPSDTSWSQPSSASTLGMLQQQSSHPRRLRPPLVLANTTARDEPRVPLRQQSREELRTNSDKVSRRESRVNLRGLFSRSKTSGQDARASIADFSSWSPFHTPRVENAHAKSASPQSSLPRVIQEETLPPQQYVATSSNLQEEHSNLQPKEATHIVAASKARETRPTAPSRNRPSVPLERTARGSLAPWDPPPLFQAYPQAVKHAQLPICTTSIEVLKRLQAATEGTRADAVVSLADRAAAAEKISEKPKRRHRRNGSDSSIKLEWGSKIYVLVTSGYLLQYSAEGPFDRLPEKILPISHESAAYASDLIPGCHWVLRICASTNAGGIQVTDTRSIFSRIPFRSTDRRHASTFLMVFNGAEEMEAWITVLRREIEQLGGKKLLSETGKPKSEQAAVGLRTQTSHRTLVVRDPDRFSRILNPSDVSRMMQYPPPAQLGGQTGHPYLNQHLQAPAPLNEREPIADDTSTTNSAYSQDDRQLDNLRGDAGNRNSYISSDQRTVMTSDSSSPPSSPVHGEFPNKDANDEQRAILSPATSPAPVPAPAPTSAHLSPVSLSESPKSRPRPNAAAISERRQSMQAMASSQRLVDVHLLPIQLSSQQAPSDEALQQPEASVSLYNPLPTIPNFSVPHLGSTRYSASITRSSSIPGLTPCTAPMQKPQALASSASPRPAREVILTQAPLIPPTARSNNRRRLPPPTLASSRPLSIVTDQAAPHAKSPSKDFKVVAIDAPRGDSMSGISSDMSDTSTLNDCWNTPISGGTVTPTSSLWHSEPCSSLPRNHEHSNIRFSSANTEFQSPRRQSSMLSLRSSDDACAPFEMQTIAAPQRNSMVWPVSRSNAISPQQPDDGRAMSYSRPSSSYSRPQIRAASVPRQFTAAPISSGTNRSLMTREPNEYRRPSMVARPSTSSYNHTQNFGDAKALNGSVSMPSVHRTSTHQTVGISGAAVDSDTVRGRNELKVEQRDPSTLPPLLTHTNNAATMQHESGVYVRARSSSTSRDAVSRPDAVKPVNGPPPLTLTIPTLPPPPMPPPNCALPPPPAPPPTRALPPLPAKLSVGQAV